ncbi:MAG: serine O-acetyltransferase [Gemmatimonadales bacterium]
MAVQPGLIELLREDLSLKARWCYGSGKGVRKKLRLLFTDATLSMIYYRLQQWSRRHGLTPLEFLFNRLNGVFCNCLIGRGAEFGRGFVMIHSTGVVINRLVRAGDYVFLEHQVTIGAEEGESPRIGNNVFIGAGAKLIGPVDIGDGAKIGANAVVVKNVPPYATVVGIPGKVVRQRTAPPDPERCHHFDPREPKPGRCVDPGTAPEATGTIPAGSPSHSSGG